MSEFWFQVLVILFTAICIGSFVFEINKCKKYINKYRDRKGKEELELHKSICELSVEISSLEKRNEDLQERNKKLSDINKKQRKILDFKWEGLFS